MNPINNQRNSVSNPVEQVNQDNRSLVQSHSTTRLCRKPNANLFNSPKPKLRNQNGNDQDIKQFQSPVACRFVRNSAKFQYFNSDEKDVECEIVPKNGYIVRKQNRFQSPRNTLKSVISIDKIEIPQLPDSNKFINVNKKATEQNSQRKPSKTTKQFCMLQPKKRDNFNDNFQSQTTSSVNFMREENLQLLAENTKIKERVNDLKQENQYMYSQIEDFATKIAKLTEENHRLVQQKLHLSEKAEELKQEANHYKKLYKNNQCLLKNYSVLEHVYSKLKYENQATQKRNQGLVLENEKLLNKVAMLTKMLDESPIKSKIPRSKSRSRELSPVYNKQNCQTNTSFINISSPKLNKTSRKDESIFQLSPE